MADQLLAGIPPVFASNGEVVAGGTVTFYQTGTATLVEIWADQAGAVSLTNPITLDAAGRAPQVFYTGSVAVREVIKNAAGVQVDDIDPSPRFSVTASGADGITFSPIGSNPAENVQDAIENISDALASFADTPVATVGGGTANAITLTSGKSLTSVATGQKLSFIGALSNTGAMTVAVDGLPAVAIKTITGATTPGTYVRAGVLTEMTYDGAQWIADRIVETGTGFERRANGVQLCWNAAVTMTMQTSANLRAVWVYPKSFIAEPAVAHTPDPSTATLYGTSLAERVYFGFAAVPGKTNASATLDIYRVSGAPLIPALATMATSPTAIGRWYA
jgi:hypothetical protein